MMTRMLFAVFLCSRHAYIPIPVRKSIKQMKRVVRRELATLASTRLFPVAIDAAAYRYFAYNIELNIELFNAGSHSSHSLYCIVETWDWRMKWVSGYLHRIRKLSVIVNWLKFYARYLMRWKLEISTLALR